MKTFKLLIANLILICICLETHAQERRTIVAPKNSGGANQATVNKTDYQVESFLFNEINLKNNKKLICSDNSGKRNDVYAEIEDISINFYFIKSGIYSNGKCLFPQGKGAGSPYAEIKIKVAPYLFRNDGSKKLLTEVIQLNRTHMVQPGGKCFSIEGLTGLSAFRSGNVNGEFVPATGGAGGDFSSGKVLFDIDNTGQVITARIPFTYFQFFNTRDENAACELYRGIYTVSDLKLPELIISGLIDFNMWEKPGEKKTAEIQIPAGSKKSEDDFWNSPAKAVAENKKNDFWDSPAAAAAESKKDDFWDSPSKISAIEIKQSNDSLPVIGSFTDPRDGKSYKHVKIGSQIWMAENLNYVTYSGSWCYDDNSSNCAVSGRLYNWEAAEDVCPSGWHLPSIDEWIQLITYLGGWEVAGGKLKSLEHWGSRNVGATNETGFNAIPGGVRAPTNFFAKDSGVWWSSTEYGLYSGKYYHVYTVNLGGHHKSVSSNFIDEKDHAISVRCLKD